MILHNFLISKKDLNGITVDKYDENGTLAPGNWRETTEMDGGLGPISTQGSTNFSKSAAEIRIEFMNYFMGYGQVSWQDSMC